MAVTYTLFGASHFGGDGAHTVNGGVLLDAALGVTAVAGDWILLCEAGVDGGGLDDVVLSDNVDTVGADWDKVFDNVAGAGDDQFRFQVWRKLCVGGETGVEAEYSGSTNKSMQGVVIHDAGDLEPYVIDSGEVTWDGSFGVFTVGSAPDSDGETYFALAGSARTGFSSADFAEGNTGGDHADLSGAAHVTVHYIEDAEHTTADRPSYKIQPNMVVSVAILGLGVVIPDSPGEEATTVFDVNDFTQAYYCRAGRPNVLTITSDKDVTFLLQTSPDGETWYDLSGGSYGITADSSTARGLPAGLFYYRLKCTVADDGPATCMVCTQGGY